MKHSVNELPPCLLTYRFSSSPDPIQVSTAQTAAQARINAAVFAGGQSVFSDQIRIAVPVGGDAGDLSESAPSASINTGKWGILSIERKAGRDLDIARDGNYAVFSFTCRDQSDYGIGYNLVFGLKAQVNLVPGDFELLIWENSGTVNDPGQFTAKSSAFVQSKFTPVFYLSNFMAAADDAPTVPCTEFGSGAAIRLSWESNGTYYRIYQKNTSTPVYQGTATSFTLAGGIKTDSTFVLAASVTGDPGDDRPQGEYEPVYLYDALTITVGNPDLTPNTVRAAGNITTPGSLEGGSLTVGGAASLLGPAVIGTAQAPASLSVAGNTEIIGSLQVKWTARTGALEVDGSLAAKGDLEIDGSLAARGDLGVDGIASAGFLQAGSINIRNHASVGGSLDTGGTVNCQGLSANGRSFFTAGYDNAICVNSNSSQYFSSIFDNHSPRSGSYITGVGSHVAQSGDYGFGTNGKYVSMSGNALITHLPTRNGYRVVTSPLCPEAEVHISGSGRLDGGRAVVYLDDGVGDMILHYEIDGNIISTYKVLLTAAGMCNGLAVTRKRGDRFEVRELGNGTSNACFDWLIIGSKPAELGVNKADALPERLPDMEASVADLRHSYGG